ncbi:MAG TPA: hypothetical protein DCM05_02375 [Elusimicrobia bacterium]|nr:hypothetical protein [Elusimicrobiota bacterium]
MAWLALLAAAALAEAAPPRIGLLYTEEQALAAEDKLPYYSKALKAHGAEIVPLFQALASSETEARLDSLDGLLVPGGDDVSPDLYGEEPHPKLETVDKGFDLYEFAAVKRSLERKLPILGICKGHQLLNVYAGGSLYQDLPSQVGKIVHRVREDGKSKPCYHEVDLKKGSLLRALLGKDRIRVNSYHHQAVKRPAEGFTVAAAADDGVVEAMEKGSILAVQFHPEKEREAFDRIFAHFGLETWIAAQRKLSLERLLRNVSSTGTVVEKEFDEVHADPARKAGLKIEGGKIRASITPKPGSVVAAPAGKPPEPDYFFHWVRDSALVMSELAALGHDQQVKDFAAFSRSLQASDLGEPRFNADGSRDFLRWSRPQYDGPALRALALLRVDPEAAKTDLDFIASDTEREGFDLWEEYRGHDYYTRAVQAAALRAGGRVEASRRLYAELDKLWLEDKGYYAFALGPRTYWDGTVKEKPGEGLDVAVLLAALHGGLTEGRTSPLDERVLSTAVKLEDLFESLYPFNKKRAEDEGVAMGRYNGDTYFGGNPWVFATMAYAELHYRAAELLSKKESIPVTPLNREFLSRALRRAGGGALRDEALAERESLLRGLVLRGDDLLRTLKRATPPSGELAEQFDKETGAPASGRDLSWSHSSFLSATDARARALVRLGT